jgi:hypothetical protein
MLEKKIVEKIKKYLLSLPRCYVMKVHGSQFTTGQPDLIGCFDGRSFCLEVKQPGKKATPLQEKRLREWSEAGALTGVVTSVDEVREVVYGADGKKA